VMFVLVPVLLPSEGHLVFERSSPWWSYPVFLQNFLVAVPTQALGPLGASWSLAIEEQFYLAWPLVVRFCSVAQLRRVAVVMIVVAAPLTFYLQAQHVLIYSNVFCRQVGLMSGALLALVLHGDGWQPGRYLKPAWILFALTLTLAFVSEARGARWLAFTMVALASASFIFLALYSTNKRLQSLLRNRFLMYTGTISYGLYLLHKLVDDLAQTLQVDRHPWLLLPFIFAGSYAAATVSWNVLERPFLRLKRSFSPPPTT
jgi:peptidoglycan/LPS O-acetylase OafA/YrhL